MALDALRIKDRLNVALKVNCETFSEGRAGD
jgi:hypothetical protein